MEIAVLIGMICGLAGAVLLDDGRRGSTLRTERFATSLPAESVRELFAQQAIEDGWTVIDSGDRLVARRSGRVGSAQQVVLAVEPGAGDTRVTVVRGPGDGLAVPC